MAQADLIDELTEDRYPIVAGETKRG